MPEKSPPFDAYEGLADAGAARVDTRDDEAHYERLALLLLIPDVGPSMQSMTQRVT